MGWGSEGRQWGRPCSRRKKLEDQAKDQAASVCSSESAQICCAVTDSTLLDSSVVLCRSQCRAEGLQKVGKVTGALFDRVHLETSELVGKRRTKWPPSSVPEEERGNLFVCERKATKICPTKGYN